MITEIERKVLHYNPPTIDKKKKKSVSFSQFSTYQSCPHKWYLQYALQKYEDKPSIHATFGTAIHETMQHYLEIMYKESGTAADKLSIKDIFEENFRKVYQETYNQHKQHFSSAIEMGEFYDDGIAILEWFVKHRKEYFSTRKVKLLGIEIPLIQGVKKNVYLKGYIDFVLYDEDLDKIFIYDIKTSTRGWTDKEKKDETKVSQIVIYKQYFSKQYDVDIDKIDVQFFIVKRKIWENSEFPQSRIQVFKPASGKTTRNKVLKNFESFLNECFDNEGKILLEKTYPKNVGKISCTYCPYNNSPELCDKKSTVS